MSRRRNVWAVVLAAGDGTRLASLTQDASGNSVPKQFCSLNGAGALVHEAVLRARQVVPSERVTVIVARQHARYWRKALYDVPRRNVIVQPHNRGTANGIVLSVLAILDRDPLARIVFMPADHYVLNEGSLELALRELSLHLRQSPDGLVLVGIEPDEADPELGYIVPGPTLSDGSRRVTQFVEKPTVSLAMRLCESGALWNSFIFAADANWLLSLLRRHLGTTVDDMATALARDAQGRDSAALSEFYETLAPADFSREVVQQAPHALRVVRAPACGWNDLGTPRRVADTLRRLAQTQPRIQQHAPSARPASTSGLINLATQHARMALAG
jgi:mannose-1-phosphate guanylyltransferase